VPNSLSQESDYEFDHGDSPYGDGMGGCNGALVPSQSQSIAATEPFSLQGQYSLQGEYSPFSESGSATGNDYMAEGDDNAMRLSNVGASLASGATGVENEDDGYGMRLSDGSPSLGSGAIVSSVAQEMIIPREKSARHTAFLERKEDRWHQQQEQLEKQHAPLPVVVQQEQQQSQSQSPDHSDSISSSESQGTGVVAPRHDTFWEGVVSRPGPLWAPLKSILEDCLGHVKDCLAKGSVKVDFCDVKWRLPRVDVVLTEAGLAYDKDGTYWQFFDDFNTLLASPQIGAFFVPCTEQWKTRAFDSFYVLKALSPEALGDLNELLEEVVAQQAFQTNTKFSGSKHTNLLLQKSVTYMVSRDAGKSFEPQIAKSKKDGNALLSKLDGERDLVRISGTSIGPNGQGHTCDVMYIDTSSRITSDRGHGLDKVVDEVSRLENLHGVGRIYGGEVGQGHTKATRAVEVCNTDGPWLLASCSMLHASCIMLLTLA
jgi:hypothetical protein